jgi:glucose-6-phosphate 1-epimerase
MNNSGNDQKSSSVEVTKEKNGVNQVVLRNPRGAYVKVSLYGGQVLSWRTDRGEELLFTSSKAVFKPPHAVRGGIPICFPQVICKPLCIYRINHANEVDRVMD